VLFGGVSLVEAGVDKDDEDAALGARYGSAGGVVPADEGVAVFAAFVLFA